MFKSHFFECICPRVRAALVETFNQLPAVDPTRYFTAVSLETGSAAILPSNFRPDLAIVSTAASAGTGANRGPGDCKVSWKWVANWRT